MVYLKDVTAKAYRLISAIIGIDSNGERLLGRAFSISAKCDSADCGGNMKLEGSCAIHRIITRECRMRPADDFIKDVLEPIEKELRLLDIRWDKASDVKFHVALTVERP